MLVIENIPDLHAFLGENKKLSIGFVPTMGALHQGHLSLLEASKKENDVTVCSIFVNPEQFNKEEDLINYPRDIESDIKILENGGCDIVFIPSIEEMYPKKVEKKFDFGGLSNVMEGEFRPGHFNGVAIVIERFFEIIRPTNAYFGEKDFQQLAVIRALVDQLEFPVNIIACPIIREKNGLAMSSRNQRLSAESKEKAAAIFSTLSWVKNNQSKLPLTILKEKAIASITKDKAIHLEYFEIADGYSLKSIEGWNDSDYCVAFAAINIDEVRLIDNMTIIN